MAVKVNVVDGLYRGQKVSGVFDLLAGPKLGKAGRRACGDFWYITVKLDPSQPEFSGWGLKRDKVRVIVPSDTSGFNILNEVDTAATDVSQNVDVESVSQMVNALPDVAAQQTIDD
ncbi:MAG: hypothetical protein NZZ41_03130 [Candidatus Dojkabacteria bacterium]|nr:hypothetical protein [Candidatus Dojkabacteria bacterium]